MSEIQKFSVFSNGSRTFRARFQGTGEYDDQFSIRSNVRRVTNSELMEAITCTNHQTIANYAIFRCWILYVSWYRPSSCSNSILTGYMAINVLILQ